MQGQFIFGSIMVYDTSLLRAREVHRIAIEHFPHEAEGIVTIDGADIRWVNLSRLSEQHRSA